MCNEKVLQNFDSVLYICSFKTSISTEIGSIASEWEIKSGGSNRMNDYQEKVLQNVDSIIC